MLPAIEDKTSIDHSLSLTWSLSDDVDTFKDAYSTYMNERSSGFDLQKMDESSSWVDPEIWEDTSKECKSVTDIQVNSDNEGSQESARAHKSSMYGLSDSEIE